MPPKKKAAKKKEVGGTTIETDSPVADVSMPEIDIIEEVIKETPYETCVYHEKHEPKIIMSNEVSKYEKDGWTQNPGTLKTRWINTIDGKWTRG